MQSLLPWAASWRDGSSCAAAQPRRSSSCAGRLGLAARSGRVRGGGRSDRTLHSSPIVDPTAPCSPRTRRRGARRLEPPAAGFGLLEALVASGLIVVLATGVAQLTLASVAAVRAAGDETLALLLAVQKMEELRSLVWEPMQAGHEPGSAAETAPPGTSRRGPLSVSTGGSLDANVPGFVDYLSRRGTRVGGGARPPSGTAFVRRWSVQPAPRLPDDLLVLDVVVLPLHAAERAGRTALSPNLPDVIWLSALKGRR